MNTPSTKPSVQEPSDSREYGRPGNGKRDYRSPAVQAEARLGGPIGTVTDVELQAVAHLEAGPSQRAYLAILEKLRDRQQKGKRAAARLSPSERQRRQNAKKTSHQTTRGYARSEHCRAPIPVVHGNVAGSERVRLVGCAKCETCRRRAAEVTAHQALSVVGPTGYAWTVSEDRYRAEVVALNRRGIQWAQVPGPTDTRRIVADEPIGPSVPVTTLDAIRDAELSRPADDRRRVSYRGQRATDPAERPPTREEVTAALYPTASDEEPGWTLLGFWHLRALRVEVPGASAALAALADTFGIEAAPIPGGIETDPAADRVALAEFHRRIGYTPLALTRRRSQVPPKLPIAEAYELWKWWQEDLEPPAAMYDQLAMLEGVA